MTLPDISDILLNTNDSSNNSVNDVQNILLSEKVHIRMQQRTAKKSITIVENLPKETAVIALKELKIKLGCIGTLKNNTLHFSGDQRDKINDYLLSKDLVSKENIVLHGF